MTLRSSPSFLAHEVKVCEDKQNANKLILIDLVIYRQETSLGECGFGGHKSKSVSAEYIRPGSPCKARQSIVF